jgi:hypothetical protein
MNGNIESTLMRKILTVAFILLTSVSLHSQSVDPNGIGIFVALEHNRFGFKGTHVMNQAFENSRAYTSTIGFGKEDKFEIGFSLGFLRNELVDTRLVSFTKANKPFLSGSLKVPILESRRFAFLIPEVAFGRIRNNLQGRIGGDFFQVANNFRYEIGKTYKLYIKVAYQRTGYDVTASQAVLPLFEVSHAFIATIGIQINRFANL